MMGPWRRLALAAAIYVTAGAGVTTAQTVIVRNAPAGTAIELVLNTDAIGTVKADAKGEATLPVNLPAHGGRAETDVNIYVDVCEGIRRVVLVERGLQPPAPEGASCSRKPIPELFALRPMTTLLVDVGGASPTVWLRQGPAPAAWLRDEVEDPDRPAGARRPSPKGLVFFAGGGFTKIRDARKLACGTLEECSGDDFVLAFTGGITYWFTRYLAAEVSYTRPMEVTANADAGNYRFDTAFDTHILSLGGKVGIPIGPVRIYGLGGATYHQATSLTDQTVDERTETIDGVTRTIAGATQSFQLRTDGWAYHFGGGVEGWVKPSWALYVEAGQSALKGKTVDIGEGEIDDRATYVMGGIRVKIGG